VVETQWTVLAQVLAPPELSRRVIVIEADAANKAWSALMGQEPIELDVSSKTSRDALGKSIGYAMQCFTDLLEQMEEMEVEPSADSYAWETMSESLVSSKQAVAVGSSLNISQKLASVCCVAMRELDAGVNSRLMELLSAHSQVSDRLVQEAALNATTVLVQRSADF
jgi:phosphatidylinositol 4-kinase